jgi:hypothetical protein
MQIVSTMTAALLIASMTLRLRGEIVSGVATT